MCVGALLHSLQWEKRNHQVHFTDEETEFVLTELVMTKLGQNPAPPALASLCPQTSFFP